MINKDKYEEYKESYYRTSVNLEDFERLVRDHIGYGSYNISEIVTSETGLSFNRERLSAFPFMRNYVRLVYSQRNGFGLLTVTKYAPKIYRYIRWILFGLFIAATVLLMYLNVKREIVKFANLYFTAFIFFMDIIFSMIHRSSFSDISDFIRRYLSSAQKINITQYSEHSCPPPL